MSDINKIIIIGNLVRDPELKYLQTGTAVTKFSIANNKTYTSGGEKKKETSFFLTIWLPVFILQPCRSDAI